MYMQFGCLAFDETIQVSTTRSTLPSGARVDRGAVGAAPGWRSPATSCRARAAAARTPACLRCSRVQYSPMIALLLLEQVDGGVELLLVERVRVLDAEVGLRLHQVQRGVGDVDRRVVRGDLALVRRVRRRTRRPTSPAPASRRRCCTSGGWRPSRAGCRTATPSTRVARLCPSGTAEMSA